MAADYVLMHRSDARNDNDRKQIVSRLSASPPGRPRDRESSVALSPHPPRRKPIDRLLKKSGSTSPKMFS